MTISVKSRYRIARMMTTIGMMTQGMNFPGVFEYLIILSAAKKVTKARNIKMNAINVPIFYSSPSIFIPGKEF